MRQGGDTPVGETVRRIATDNPRGSQVLHGERAERPDPPDGVERILLRLGADTDKLKDE